MALSDLCQEVQKEATLDVSIERRCAARARRCIAPRAHFRPSRRICNAILERLQKDTSNDVQSIAVKWCARALLTRDVESGVTVSAQPVHRRGARAREPGGRDL